jgi:hypothetical protein
VGKNFDPDFKSELTPEDFLTLGVLCGKYLTDTQGEFPDSWFKRANFPHQVVIVRLITMTLMPANRCPYGRTIQMVLPLLYGLANA